MPLMLRLPVRIRNVQAWPSDPLSMEFGFWVLWKPEVTEKLPQG